MSALAATVKRLEKAAGAQLEADVKRRSGTGVRTMPMQVPGKSVQVVGTPRELLDAVEARFGRLAFDLAATKENAVVDQGRFFGPGSSRGTDALVEDWSCLKGNLWLNPEFGDIKIWASKCARTMVVFRTKGCIFLLIPASVGSNWWADYVDKKAAVFFLSPRITFKGHTSAYPKDIALCVFGAPSGYECWRWKP